MKFASAFCCILLFAAVPAVAGPPYVTDDPEPVDPGHVEINIAAQDRFHRGGREGGLPMVDANYGPTDDVQLHLGLSLAFQKTSGERLRAGYGDTELAVKYRFIHQDKDGWMPDVAIYPNVTLPTGSAPKDLGTGHTHEFFPVWAQKDFGDWSTFGGGGYWNNPGHDNKNYWLFGWALLRKIDDDLTLGVEAFHQTSDTVHGNSTTGFNVGGVYEWTEHSHLLFSAGRGLTRADETNRFAYYLGYQLAF